MYCTCIVSISLIHVNPIGGVMVSALPSSLVDRGFDPDRVKPKTIKLIFVASLIITQH